MMFWGGGRREMMMTVMEAAVWKLFFSLFPLIAIILAPLAATLVQLAISPA